MSAAAGTLLGAVLLLAALLLVFGAWEARASRRGQAGLAGSRGRVPSVASYAFEVRLLAWGWLAALVWAEADAVRLGLLPVGAAGRAWVLPGGIALGFLLVFFGHRIAMLRPFPGRIRWVLAPFHGLSMLLLWLFGAGAVLWRARRQRPSAVGRPDPSAPVSPREGVRDLAALPLEEVMIPRSQVVALEGARPVREAVLETRRAPHALYPVYGESVDQPLGVARILDLAAPANLDRPVREIARPAPIVPETMRGLSLLRDLCGAPISAALVVDEFGGMAGFVTVEDLVEVVVGDLIGEHEVVRARILPLGDGGYRVEGTTSVEEFNRRFGSLLPEGEYETVAGFFLDREGRIPQPGDEITLPGLTLEVSERTERRILWLIARVRADSGEVRNGGRRGPAHPARPV